MDPGQWQRWWQTVPGNDTGDCVGVVGVTEGRSGDFIAGNFRSFVAEWNGDLEHSKLFFIPLHPSDAEPTLDVTAWHARERLDQAAHYRFEAYSWTTNGWPFYAAVTVLPRPGRWRIFASAGRDNGCFDVEVG